MLRSISCAALALAGAASAHAQPQQPATRAIIESFAADFALDPYLDRESVFGVEIEGVWWTVTATPGVNGEPGLVRVADGAPASPTFYFTATREIMDKVGRGEITALTAMVKSNSAEVSPMELELMEGFQPSADALAWALPLIFHFWTRGQPELIAFGATESRVAHGAWANVLYYQPGFRSLAFTIQPGQHANADIADQSRPFQTLFIVTEGRVNARIGGRDRVLSAGEAAIVPGAVTHEYTNPYDAPARGFVLMFGRGA